AVPVVELARERLEGLPEELGGEEPRTRWRCRLAELPDERSPRLDHLGPPRLPGLRDRAQEPRERGEPVAVGRREVGAAVEGHAVGGQEDAHGPAALTGHRLHGLHVDLVDVGPLLPVHLDAHEVLVQQPGGLGILERLVLHHVAPVARRVPDGEEDRPVLVAGAGKGVRAPRVPVDGVVLVLEEVGARLLGEAVHGRVTNGSAVTRAVRAAPSTVTATAVPGVACSRRTKARAMGRSSAYERTALVTWPTSRPSAPTAAPGGGTVVPSSVSPVSRRFTWPRSRLRTTTSWPM